MYITATTILLFFILWAIVDGNEKATNARWEASDECKRLDFEMDLARDFYGPSDEELKIQKEEAKEKAKKEKIKRKEETREALVALSFLVILIGFAFYYNHIISLVPASISNIFLVILNIINGIITLGLMFIAPPIILAKWKPVKFWSVHCFCYSLFLLLFIAFIISIIVILFQ